MKINKGGRPRSIRYSPRNLQASREIHRHIILVRADRIICWLVACSKWRLGSCLRRLRSVEMKRPKPNILSSAGLRLSVLFQARARPCSTVEPESINLSPEAVANGGNRAAKFSSDLFPLVPGSSEHKNVSISRR